MAGRANLARKLSQYEEYTPRKIEPRMLERNSTATSDACQATSAAQISLRDARGEIGVEAM